MDFSLLLTLLVITSVMIFALYHLQYLERMIQMLLPPALNVSGQKTTPNFQSSKSLENSEKSRSRRSSEERLEGKEISLETALCKHIHEAASCGEEVCLFEFGVTDLHDINRENGNCVGDRMIQHIIETVRTVTRNDDYIIHLGNRVFLVSISATAYHGRALLSRLEAALEGHDEQASNGKIIGLQVIIGMANCQPSPDDVPPPLIKNLIRAANRDFQKLPPEDVPVSMATTEPSYQPPARCDIKL
jgi:GGDEF domain-containing protein